MNIQAYIESGILEMYALDQLDPIEKDDVELMISLFPELQKELESIQHALETYAASCAIVPRPYVKDKIKDLISNLEKEGKMDPHNLPYINNYSDHTQWLNLIKDRIPYKPEGDAPFIDILQQSDKIVQMVVVSSTDFEDEVHDDEYESFLILKGRCKCTIGESVRFMDEGEFMAIPLHEHHAVEVLTETVVAIVQRVSVSYTDNNPSFG